MRTAVAGVVAVAVLALVGVGVAAPSNTIALHRTAAATTDLTFQAINTSVGRARFHISCGPVGGDLPDPARACAALAANPKLITNPKPFTCVGGTFSWWVVTITGQLNGKSIRRVFSTCWTPQMATLGRLGMTWDVLQAHLLPRRHEVVIAGTKRLFPSGALSPSDLVTCNIRGHHLEIGVPSITGRPISTGFNGENVVGVNLEVTRHGDGSVTAACLVVR